MPLVDRRAAATGAELKEIDRAGCLELLASGQIGRYGNIAIDPHGHMRLGEIEFGRMIKDRLTARLAQFDLTVTLIDKDLGYELRCADPIPFDAAYCRDLGYAAVRFLLGGGSDAMVSVQGGRMVPIAFTDIREPGTGRTRVRMVNTDSEGYRVAREYMIRLEPEDFEDAYWLDKLASAGNMTPEDFRDKFGYLSGHVSA